MRPCHFFRLAFVFSASTSTHGRKLHQPSRKLWLAGFHFDLLQCKIYRLSSSPGNSVSTSQSTMFLFHMDKSKQEKQWHPPLSLSILIPTLAVHASNSTPPSTLSVFLTNCSESNERYVETIYYRQKDSAHLDQHNSTTTLGSLRDLGNFPKQLSVVAHCVNKPNRLCLNMLDEHVPGKQI